MKTALEKLIKRPREFIPFAKKASLRRLCPIFQDTSFFLQAQMDIHPEALWHTELAQETGGFFPSDSRVKREMCDLEPYDNTRRDMLILLLRTVIENQVAGAFAELGVYRGYTAKLIHHYAPERPLHLFDTFEGFTHRGVASEAERTGRKVTTREFADTSLEQVARHIGPLSGHVHFHKGFFPDSIPTSLFAESFAFVHLDADLHDSIRQGLEFFYPRLARRSVLIVHDYNSWPGARKAVDSFFRGRAELPIPMPDKSGSALIVKQ